MSTERDPGVITKSTRVPLGHTVTIIVALLGGTWIIASQLERMTSSIEANTALYQEQSTHLTKLRDDMEKLYRDHIALNAELQNHGHRVSP